MSARPAACPVSEALTATSSPSGEWLTGKDLAGTSRRQPSLTGAYTYTFAVAGISWTPALSMSGDVPGSSPPARGLQRHVRGRVLPDRFIPARAGSWAPCWCRQRSPNTVHPRPRGVCAKRDPTNPNYSGSSPPARGLLRSRVTTLEISRFIPARAGSAMGSSPPARGLPFGRDILHPPVGGLPLVWGSGRYLSPAPLRLGLLQEMQGDPMPEGFIRRVSRLPGITPQSRANISRGHKPAFRSPPGCLFSPAG